MEQGNMVRRRSRHDVPIMGCLMVSDWKQELDSPCWESSMHGTALQRQRGARLGLLHGESLACSVRRACTQEADCFIPHVPAPSIDIHETG